MSTGKQAPNINAIDCIKKLDCNKDDVLIFQLPVATKDMNSTYINGAKSALQQLLPIGRVAMVIGNDINIYTVTHEEALSLKLKGIAH